MRMRLLSPQMVPLGAEDGVRSTAPSSPGTNPRQVAQLEWAEGLEGSLYQPQPRPQGQRLRPVHPDSSCSFSELPCSRRPPPIQPRPSPQPHTPRNLMSVSSSTLMCTHAYTPLRLQTCSTQLRMRAHMCEHILRSTVVATHTKKSCVHLGERQGCTGAWTMTPR